MQSLSPDDIEADHKKMTSASNRLVGIFENMKLVRPKEVADAMKKNLVNFRPYLPVIRSLCNPGLMDRHMKMLGEAIFGSADTPFNGSEYTTESLMTTHKCTEKKDMIEEISDKASKEFSNMKTMEKMKEEWAPLEFTPIPCEGKDSYILSGEAVELIQTALDDHIIKTQTMKGSPFAKFMLDEITEWEANILRTQDNLDLWLKVQSVWMYLEPVFSSEDIINQMPTEGKMFKEVNTAWHSLMNRIHD